METCLWCLEQGKVVEHLEQYASGSLSLEKYNNATNDLNVCKDCMSVYHLARSQVPNLHKELWKLETTRLLTYFSQMCQEEEDDLVVGNYQEEPVKTTDFKDKLPTPLIELLKYPYLLADAKLSDQFLKALHRVIKQMREPSEKYKGIYLLFVHPNEKNTDMPHKLPLDGRVIWTNRTPLRFHLSSVLIKNDEVRSWAVRAAPTLGRNDLCDVGEVLACMFGVLELGFLVSREIFDPSSACNGKLQSMPTHLYDSDVKNFLLGIGMLLTALDDQAMDSLFLGPNKQTNILQCILNIMEGREYDSTCDPFWPALQCFMVILDRCGPLIWGYIEPIKAFDTIAYSSSYISEIESIRTNGSFVNVKKKVKEEIKDEQLVTCSQMCHKSSPTEACDQQLYLKMTSLAKFLRKKVGQEMYLYKSTFLWFIPFVRSLMEMAECSIDYVRRVVQHLSDKVSQMVTMSAIWDEVTVIFAYLLVRVVKKLIKKKRLDILHACPDIWAKVVVKGAIFTNIAEDKMFLSSPYSMRNFGRPPGEMSSSIRNTLHMKCLKVICLVLKPGDCLDSNIHPRAFYFLNLVNKRKREVENSWVEDSLQREWTLPETEQQDLEKCLTTTVSKKIAMPPSTPATSLDNFGKEENALQRCVIQEKSKEIGEKSNMNVIVISDEDDCGVERNDLGLRLKIKKEPEDMVESPGRDFDGDLSESQVFGLETQEDLKSVWDDAHIDSAGPKALKIECVKPKSPPPKAPANKLKLTVIEPQHLRKKRTPAAHRVTQKRNTDAPSTSCGRTSTPAIVPPKKVKKAVEPESTVERLGLKKRERMAIELSQSSLDCVDALRRYGQTMQLGKKQKQTRKSNTTTSSKTKEKYKKLLPPQERQFFRQSSNQAQKATSTSFTKQITALSPPMQAQKVKACVSEEGNHEGNEKKADNSVGESCALDQCSNGGGDGTPTGSVADADSTNNDGCHVDSDYYDWYLSVMNPANMELCSQMYQFDKRNDHAVFLMQRDPVGMDVESTMPSLSRDQPKETAPQLSTIQTPPSLDQSLKLGVAPVAQNKARSCTVKIRTGSSRSETMLKDMEKVPAPKPKTAHQAPMPPPLVPPPTRFPPAQPEFRVPLQPHPPPSEPCNKPTPQPPTYKTYPRPEAPTSSSRQSPSTHRFKASILKANVLKWKYSWFQHYKQFGVPEDLCDMPLKRVPETFSSFEDYYHTFFPLLLTNTFAELANDWLSKKQERLQLEFESGYCSLDTDLYTKVTKFTAPMTPGKEYPREDDVVILWLPQNMATRTHFSDESADCQPHFGIVCCSNVINTGGRQEMKLKIQTCSNVLSINKQLVGCELVGSMLSALRELNALCHIDKNLFQPILSPAKHFPHFLPPSTHLDPGSERCNSLREDQAKAIDCGVSMVMGGQQTLQICMILGAIGTGKGDTIVNLLYRLSKLGVASQKVFRALICAPSDAAVRDLMKKIIRFFQDESKQGHHKGNCGDVNLVMLGSEKTLGEKLYKFSLDHQTRIRLEKAQKQLKGIKQKMQNLKDPEKLAQLNKEKERLSHQIKGNTQHLILQEANVIGCTVKTSGSFALESAFLNPGRLHFDCVIIYDAGQAKELETLIPLKFDCPSLILVGDPQHLQIKVTSQKAKELGYDQSLMARLYKCIQRLSSPHVHILSHPNKMTALNHCSGDWPCVPYRVFDVTDGQEMRKEDSYCNPKEVKLTVELVRLVIERYQSHGLGGQDGVIGVITLCNAQKTRICQALNAGGLQEVVVDTVDGFQGREMNCIIVSCVRASNEKGSIGFPGFHRMHVDKYSLFILGHLRTLRENQDWRTIIEAADSCGTIITTEEKHFKTDALKIFKQDALALHPHRTQDQPSHPSDRPQFSRSHSTPLYPNYSRTSSTSRAPQPTKASRDPRTNRYPSPPRASSYPAPPRASSYPSPSRASSYPSPPRSAPSMTTREANPADPTRDLQLPGSSSNYRSSFGHDRRRHSPTQVSSTSQLRRNRSFSYQH